MIELPGRTGVAQVRLVHGLRDKEPQEIPILPYSGTVRSLSRPKIDTSARSASLGCLAKPAISTFEFARPDESVNRDRAFRVAREKNEIRRRWSSGEARFYQRPDTRALRTTSIRRNIEIPSSIASSFLCGFAVTFPRIRATTCAYLPAPAPSFTFARVYTRDESRSACHPWPYKWKYLRFRAPTLSRRFHDRDYFPLFSRISVVPLRDLPCRTFGKSL